MSLHREKVHLRKENFEFCSSKVRITTRIWCIGVTALAMCSRAEAAVATMGLPHS